MRALFAAAPALWLLIHGTSHRVHEPSPLAFRGFGAGRDSRRRVRNAYAIGNPGLRFASGYGPVDEPGCVADRFASPRAIVSRSCWRSAPDERRADFAGGRDFKEVQRKNSPRV